MNRKGFTLLELLTTFVILGFIILVSVFSISRAFNITKKKSEDVFVETIKDAMDMYLTTEDVKKLNFTTECSNLLNKSFGDRKVYKSVITFSDVINSQYRPIATSDFVNPSNEDVQCNTDASLTIYRDEDYVYYYSVSKSDFGCLKNVGTDEETGVEYKSVISNLPEGFVC